VSLTLGAGAGYLARGRPPAPPLDTGVAERLAEVVEQDAAGLRAAVDRLGPADEKARAALRARLAGLKKQLAQKKADLVQLRTSPPRDGPGRRAAGQRLQALVGEVEAIAAELLEVRQDVLRHYERALDQARAEAVRARKQAGAGKGPGAGPRLPRAD
jgi:hypothetical protein